MSEKNGEIARRISERAYCVDGTEGTRFLSERECRDLIKEALDQKDAESAQLRGEVEAQKKDLELYRGKILHLKERLAFPQSKVEADQSLLIEKLRSAFLKENFRCDHAKPRKSCWVCVFNEALLPQDEKKEGQ